MHCHTQRRGWKVGVWRDKLVDGWMERERWLKDVRYGETYSTNAGNGIKKSEKDLPLPMFNYV